MLVPMIVIAGLCVLFGLWNALPLENLIQPILGDRRLEYGLTFAGWPHSTVLVIATVVVLALAYINHRIGVRLSGSGLGASNHIQHAPILEGIYERAAERAFDPYDIGLAVLGYLARILWGIDRFIDWVQESLTVMLVTGVGRGIRWVHTGSYALYVLWAIGGAAVVIVLYSLGF